MKKNSEDVEQRLRHKPVILEGFQTAQRSKKSKKKEMSAREKRIRGIYNISPKGQRLGFSLIYASCRLAGFSDGQRDLSSPLSISYSQPCFTYTSLLYGGYYMAARGYEFYLRVLKVSLTSEQSKRVRNTFSTRR